MELLALSGSLRTESINSAFCRVFSRLAPEAMRVSWFGALGELPLFNPDLEAAPPHQVLRFRAAIAHADALIVASPEYAHGVSGVMKNSLDWLVSFEGVVGKPVALINTSPRAHHAHESLAEILRTMSMDIVADASVDIPLLGYCVTESAMLESAEVVGSIGRIHAALSRRLAGAGAVDPGR
jgi:chromate reductase